MKIAHVVDSMDVGGAETLVSQMCRLQRQLGHEPLVCAISTLGDIGKQMLADGFEVRTHLGRNLPTGSRNLYRLFNEIQPDVVHIHNPTPTIYAAPAARMAGVPSILSTRHSLASAPHNVAAEIKYAFAAQFCDWIVGICDATAENIRKMHSVPARKIVRVYNGAMPLRRTPKDQRLAKSGFTYVFVGRLQPIKNLSLMLNAFKLAMASAPNLRLWIVGDGTEREMLEKLAVTLDIKEQVTFWGQQLDVAPFFSSADAFIMSSRSEGLPVSLLQAFSLGLPAIVTRVGGMAEVVQRSEAGIVVPAGNPTEMATAILKLAENSENRLRFSKNAEAAFNRDFDVQIMLANYMDLYQNTPRARGRRTS